MFIFAVSQIGMAVMALILLRGYWTRLWSKYPLFYFPLACSFVATVAVTPWILVHDRAMCELY